MAQGAREGAFAGPPGEGAGVGLHAQKLPLKAGDGGSLQNKVPLAKTDYICKFIGIDVKGSI